jgi:hypothetical protein
MHAQQVKPAISAEHDVVFAVFLKSQSLASEKD